MTPIPVGPPIGGVLWSVVVPVLLWLVTFGATYLLYRHYAGKQRDDRGGRPQSPAAPRKQ
jgi:hypothetical protein